jgi:ribulose 1,5-bisphosphate synthetase/thiazole synthase
MKRREFLSYSLPATGAVMLLPGFAKARLMAEIERQFDDNIRFEEYDVVINGAGLSGYFAAMEAMKRGLRVLVVEKRPAPGFEIAAKRRLWIGDQGVDRWDPELLQLFFPKDETREIFATGGTGPNSSRFDDELLLFAGSIKKGLLRNLLVNNVHLLLMTDVCGMITDGKKVSGALLACKHGVFTVKCRKFIDCSDNLLFSRNLIQQKYTVEKVGFVLELLGVDKPKKKIVKVPANLGLEGNEIRMHRGKNVNDQAFLEFQYTPESQKFEEIEVQSRLLAGEVGRNLKLIDDSLTKAKVHYYAYESSILLSGNTSLPVIDLGGYYLLENLQGELDGEQLLAIRDSAAQCVKKIDFSGKGSPQKRVHLAGQTFSLDSINPRQYNESNFSVPLRKCDGSIAERIHDSTGCQVVVGGSGTSGAPVAMGAAEMGADVVAVDYFNDPGGTKTVGGVMGYYHGLRDNRFLDRLEGESDKLANEIGFNKKPGRQYYFLKWFKENNVKFLSGSIVCGSIVEDGRVKGILICRNGKLEKVLGDIVVDSTGDGDIACFAGAGYRHGNDRNGMTQNYSQWNLAGGGKSPTPITSDYDIIDNTKISELQRGLFLSHYEAHFYDFHPYLTVRESRRIIGDYELNLIDAVEKTHFDDLVAVASSDYDPHFVGYGEYSRCGFLLPHSNIVKVEIPFRSLLPKGLEGVMVVGKAFSQTHNVLQFTRMSADLTVLGYLAGQIAAKSAVGNDHLRNFQIKELQKEWFSRGFIPGEFSDLTTGNRLNDPEEIDFRIKSLGEGKDEFLYECCRLSKESCVTELKNNFHSSPDGRGKLLLAKALAWFGESEGCRLIMNELAEMFDEERSKGYPGGFVETYDDIRGREKNMLKGLFWRINQNMALLAMAGYREATSVIRHILDNTVAGGGMVKRESDYYDERIDLKIIPFYNRILNLCFFAERVPDSALIPGLEKLLDDENVGGYMTDNYHETRWKVFGAVLETAIASALARCGSKRGYSLLVDYLDDIHFNLSNFAANELKELTGRSYSTDREQWEDYLRKTSFPRATKKLVKEIEL